MELIHIICANATCPINQQSSSLEHERQIKKLSRLLKSKRVARTSHETLDCRLLGLGVGGANRDRTDDLLLAKQALSQLSYGPAPRLSKGSSDIGGSGRSCTCDLTLIRGAL
jgi:hypothetical protein